MCLQKRCLDPLTARYFSTELFIRALKVGCPLGDKALELQGGVTLRLKVGARFILASSCALRGDHGGLQRDSLKWALEKANVAKALDQFSPERGELRTFIAVGQYNEGLVRPRGLTAYPLAQGPNTITVESFLRHQHDLDDPLEIVHHFWYRVAYHRP